jgi:hypothetical protein
MLLLVGFWFFGIVIWGDVGGLVGDLVGEDGGGTVFVFFWLVEMGTVCVLFW